MQEVRCLVTEQVGLAAHYSLKAHDGEALLLTLPFPNLKSERRVQKKKELLPVIAANPMK